jgi:hypothetical protein
MVHRAARAVAVAITVDGVVTIRRPLDGLGINQGHQIHLTHDGNDGWDGSSGSKAVASSPRISGRTVRLLA